MKETAHSHPTRKKLVLPIYKQQVIQRAVKLKQQFCSF